MVDVKNGSISSMPKMIKERSAHASTLFQGSVFVAGGQSASKSSILIHDSVEK